MSDLAIARLDRVTHGYKDPEKFENKDKHLRPLFDEIQKHKVSDIFIQEGRPILTMVQNRLYCSTFRNITKSEAIWFLTEIAGSTALSLINSKKAINTTYSLFDATANSGTEEEEDLMVYIERLRKSFRVSVVGTMRRGVPSFQIVMRTIPSAPLVFTELGLSETFVRRCCPTDGMVLVAGVTGSGKSTTLAAIIRFILEHDTPIKGNIVTHEEPIEYTYDSIHSNHSIVEQSQIPENFENFEAANREVLRRKPAAILVGELRDTGTISSAIEASLTGHPVFATVHAGSIIDIVTRLLGKFENNKVSALIDIISTSSMFVAQRLIHDVNGKLFAVREHLYFTKNLKKRLIELADPNLVTAEIGRIMDLGSDAPDAIASLTFEKQGEVLLSQGKINEHGLLWLKGQH